MNTLEHPEGFRRRNQRTALYLLGWIALLVAVSVVLVWVRS